MNPPDDFSTMLDRIMLRLASDIEAGLFDEKATEKVAAIKTLTQYEMQRFRKSKGQKGGSALDAYRDKIAGLNGKEITDGHASS